MKAANSDSISARRLSLFAVPLLTLTLSATGADLYWDGGAANIGTNGDGLFPGMPALHTGWICTAPSASPARSPHTASVSRWR